MHKNAFSFKKSKIPVFFSIYRVTTFIFFPVSDTNNFEILILLQLKNGRFESEIGKVQGGPSRLGPGLG